MRFKEFLFLVLGCLMPFSLMAKELGVIGQTYPIAEPDLLQVIQIRLNEMQKTGELNQFKQTIMENREKQMDRPNPVAGITRTEQSRTWFFDPSVHLTHDIENTDGAIVFPAGSTVNPLDTVSLPYTLVFYNADDPAQVKWAQALDNKIKGQDKLILVGGSVVSQTQLFQKPVYFDQGGSLIARFQLHHVPALIIQQDKLLKISEVKS